MTFHILASNLCMAHSALGEYVTLHVPPLCFSRLYYTSSVDVFDYGERQTFAGRIKGRGSAPQSFCPPGGGGTSDERDGGPGRVQRCKTHLDTALAGVKTVDFFPLYLFLSSFVAFGDKRHANIGAGPLKPLVKAYLKCQGPAWKKWNSWTVHLPHSVISIVVNTAAGRAYSPLHKLCFFSIQVLTEIIFISDIIKGWWLQMNLFCIVPVIPASFSFPHYGSHFQEFAETTSV